MGPTIGQRLFRAQMDQHTASQTAEDLICVGLVPDATEEAVSANSANRNQPSMRRIRANFVLRSRFAEDRLKAAASAGVSQYVLLCAGLDIGDGQIVADFGCGPGHAAIEFARRVGPSGHVHALDVNAEFIDELSLVYDHSP